MVPLPHTRPIWEAGATSVYSKSTPYREEQEDKRAEEEINKARTIRKRQVGLGKPKEKDQQKEKKIIKKRVYEESCTLDCYDDLQSGDTKDYE